MKSKRDLLLAVARGGGTQEQLAGALGVSKRDVALAAAVLRDRGLTEEAVSGMTEAQVRAELFPRRAKEPDPAYLQPDMGPLLERKSRKTKIPVKLFWMEYCRDAADRGLLAYSYQDFCRKFSAEAERAGVAAHFDHEPGAKAYVDWAGDCAEVRDRVTGRAQKVYVLVVSLPASSYIYAEGFTDMRQASWLDGQANAFEEFGGTPRMLVPDNCLTAVVRGDRRVCEVNGTYESFAAHYGCAVLPARVREPRDKNTAEAAVDLVETWAIAPSSEEAFYTLEEFNGYLRERVDWLNARPFSDREGSRADFLEGVERERLQPLPPQRYELYEWRRAKVPPDYHVRVDYMHYSVPHGLVGQTVDVRLGSDRVTVMHGGEAVAEHPRLRGRKRQYSTDPAHMPPAHLEMQNPWSRARFESWADKVGPQTAACVARVLASRETVEQTFVACRNILGLAKSYGPEALERACAALAQSPSLPSYTAAKNLILGARAAEAAGAPARPAEAPAPPDDRAFRMRPEPEGGEGAC